MLRILTHFLVGIVGTCASDGKCRILVLRGGGVHGAYEVGAIKAFVETLDPIERAYDYISGVSVGALNTAIMAKYGIGDEAAGVEELLNVYRNHLISDYLEAWPLVLVRALTRNSIMDVSKAFEFFDKVIGSEPFKRKISYLSVNTANSQVVIFDETTPLAVRNKAVFSSASIPGIFPPVEIDGMFLNDGGVAINASVGDPIRRCLEEEGVSQSDIIVDVILCFDHVSQIN